jgi:hypothetical protein
VATERPGGNDQSLYEATATYLLEKWPDVDRVLVKLVDARGPWEQFVFSRKAPRGDR